MSNDADTVSKGTSLGGCTVQEKLSERAGATRYRALRESGEECVITVYDEGCFPSALVRERSIRELRQLSSLESPKILGVLDVGKLENGGIYEVNASYSEHNLADLSGPLEESAAFAVLRSIGEALLAAQNAGVIHRNLGPELIYLQEGSDAGADLRVGGFGVAEPQGEGSFGPLATCAPEQAAGKVVDQRSMVYNLAALGHRLLTGKDLYEGSPAEVLKQHMEAEIPSGVHPRLSRGLQKDARRRPMMLKQFLDELTVKSAESSQSSAAEGQKPSTRGWTQFMDDDEVEGGSASGGSSASPSADSGSHKKPATRGWTMFMESSDAEAESETPGSEQTSAAQEKSPKTRGWTMFMDSPDEEEKKEEQTPEPAVVAKAEKPKTRGWTMFMDDEPGSAPSQTGSSTPGQSPAKPQTVAPAAASDKQQQQVAASTQAPAEVGEQDGAEKPSTRGWTMFMDAPPGSENAPDAPTLDNQLDSNAAASAAVATHASERSAPATRPSANGGGVEHEVKSPSKSTSSGAPVKSAVEASNRRVSMGMPKPASPEESPAESAGQSSSGSKTKTVVLGGSQAEAVAGPSAEPSPAAATPSSPSAAASDPALASAADIAHDNAAARPLTEPAVSKASTSTSSVLSKNPIPESPAPQGNGEPSLARVAVGAGLVGVVIAALALLVMFLLG